MSKSIIAEGKTSIEAIEKGLKELHATKNMVDIKILEDEEKRSFYSILTPRVVKVELTLKENVKPEPEKEPEERKEKPKVKNENMEEIEKAKKDIENFLNEFIKDKEITQTACKL